MRRLIFLAFIFNGIIALSQDIVIHNDIEIKGQITRITKDSIEIYSDYAHLIYSRESISKVSSRNSFKSYLVNNTILDENSENLLGYSNYRLNNYLRVNHTGRILMLTGVGISLVPLLQENPNSKIAVFGGIITAFGYIVDSSSNRWLKNITLNYEYGIGVGYSFPIENK